MPGETLYAATIALQPITKKNHQEIYINQKTGKRFLSQSKAYQQYEQDCAWYLHNGTNIDYPVNVKMVFYVNSRRIVDLVSLQQSCLDILAKYDVIKDDNAKIAATYDGSCVKYDKKHPRTEITITKVKENQERGINYYEA